MPLDVAGEVMEHLKWDRGASAVFRKTCKGWRDAHDQIVTRLSVTGNALPSSAIERTRFPRVKEIGVRLHAGPHFLITFDDSMWLQTLLGGLTAHLTSLDLSGVHSQRGQVSDDGLRALAHLNPTAQ